ncbi:P-loop containing nucleoside triphosphate hydrolase protein [Flammula alnicola]|nr:P-loop containing nucleoside triphosphate hydrolase protein [Flammula alnicola]
MASSPLTIRQDIFKSAHPDIFVTRCHENGIHKSLPTFLQSVQDNVIGLAPIYGSKCRLTSLAISSKTQVLVVTISANCKPSPKANELQVSAPRDSLRRVLCQPTVSKYAFQMDKLATALHLDSGLPITAAKDLLSVSKADRHSLEALMDALGGETTLDKRAVKRLFHNEETTSNDFRILALQAWAACCAATLQNILVVLEQVPSIDTLRFDEQSLKLIAKTIRESSRLVNLKPIRVKNEVDNKFWSKSGKVTLISERYKTRVMRTADNQLHALLQMIKIEAVHPDGKLKAYTGRASRVVGRLATLAVNGNLGTARIQSVETIGREQSTSAEALRAYIMLSVLQETTTLSNHSFVSAIWFPKKTSWEETPKFASPLSLYFPSDRTLNVSQTKAVNTILSTDDVNRVVLVHGPPGTGKTTVIAASVTSIMSSSDTNRTVWLVAQSNVAVKNIAEKLASVNFIDFKILVSRDFHLGWHEHLYKKINRNVIRSDDFVEDDVATERQVLGSRVILCTLSMLSNEKLDTISRLVPLQTVIFDEASQIEIGDYFPMLVRFRPTLRKLVFIGDDKQHRMPTPIGAFISREVYKNRLKTRHSISDPQSCRFVDVSNGSEEAMGHSWKNTPEVDVAIAIARQLKRAGKPFRIITPYDPQRSLLENGLKHAKLPWEDKCFNVDAFQGNEDDYIIVSLVRSKKLGFLNDKRRVNVMLTRSRKGMIICTNRKFIEGPAANTLVGKLLKSLGDSTWVEGRQVQFSGVRPFM